MTDTGFARIKARFPTLRWEDGTPYADYGARLGSWVIEVDLHDPDAHKYVWKLYAQGGGESDQTCIRHSKQAQTLGRCLRSLECAIRREANTLAGMIGEGVAL